MRNVLISALVLLLALPFANGQDVSIVKTCNYYRRGAFVRTPRLNGANNRVVLWDFNDLKYPEGIIMIDGDMHTPRKDQIIDSFFKFKVGDGWKICKGVMPDMRAAFSLSSYTPPGQSDDWMIMPEVTIPDDGEKYLLKWQAISPDDEHSDGYEVYVQEGNPTKISDFTSKPVFTTDHGPLIFKPFSVDISQFAGKTVRIAFRNNSFDKYMLGIDDISVEKDTAPVTKENAFIETFNDVHDGMLPDGWIAIDKDNDTYNWFVLNLPEANLLGPDDQGGYLASQSVDQPADLTLKPDNWLISPEIILDENAEHELSYYVAAQEISLSKEKYGIYVTTDVDHPRNLDAYENLLIESVDTVIPADVNRNVPGSSAWYPKSLDLSRFKGKTIRLGFRHFDSSNQFMVTIDHIMVTNAKAGEIKEDDYTQPETMPKGEWIQYAKEDSKVYALGLSDKGVTTAAIRFLPADLTKFGGKELTAVKVCPTNDHAYFTVKVWTVNPGEKPDLDHPASATKIPSRLIKINTWVNKILDKSIVIDPTKELWIGCEADNINMDNPFGVQSPKSNEEADWYYYDKSLGWEHLSKNPNLNYQFCIGGLISNKGMGLTEIKAGAGMLAVLKSGQIEVQGTDSRLMIYLFDASGRQVVATMDRLFDAPKEPGVYFVKCGADVQKIIVL